MNEINQQYSPVQTSFNASMGTTFRINNLFVRIDNARLIDDLPTWLRAVEALFAIADAKLNDKEIVIIEVARTLAINKVHYLNRRMQQEDNPKLDDPLTPAYNALDNYQKVLTRYMDLHGMLMTNKADPGLAFRGDM